MDYELAATYNTAAGIGIEAAKADGAVSVGVASGHYSTDELEAASADHVLGSLEDPFPGL